MLSKKYCQRCKRMMVGDFHKVAGPSLGASVVEQLVCSECHDAFHAYMDNNFWKGADCSGKENCPKCSDRLTSQNVRPIHRRHGPDETADLAMVCECCYGNYLKACRSAMEKRKGETNG